MIIKKNLTKDVKLVLWTITRIVIKLHCDKIKTKHFKSHGKIITTLNVEKEGGLVLKVIYTIVYFICKYSISL